MKAPGSSSFSSRESHAPRRLLHVFNHSTSSVVLPDPAGAESKVTLLLSPAFKRSSRRGRGITSPLTRGRESLERIKGPRVLTLAEICCSRRSYRSRDPTTTDPASSPDRWRRPPLKLASD